MGAYLQANCLRPEALTQLCRYSLCSGVTGLDHVARVLKQHQQTILHQAGKEAPLELRLVYPNVSQDLKSLSPEVRELVSKRIEENGKEAAGFMALSIGNVAGAGGVALPIAFQPRTLPGNLEAATIDE